MSLDQEFEELLAGHEPKVQEAARAARSLVLQLRPQAHQEVYPGWGGYLLFKSAPGLGVTVCHISVHQRHVSLGLAQGAELPDPAGLLQGKGKHSRHLKLTDPAAVERPEVAALLEAAWGRQPEGSVLQDALERVRQLCARLPETSETVSHGHPTFWAGKKTFAVFGLYAATLAFKADARLHASLEGDARFTPTPYMAHAGWLSLRLDEATDWQLAGELLDHSYRLVATARLRKAVEATSRRT